MFVYVLLLSRAVPLLFWFSLCLVSARLLHDFFLRKGIALAARVVFVSILLFGIAMAAPYLRRVSLLISESLAYERGNWPLVVERLTTYESMGGELDSLFRHQFVEALMNVRLWQDAERELRLSGTEVGGVRRYTPETLIQTGVCQYYQGRLPEARTLLQVEYRGNTDEYLRHYFLGRLSDAAGDSAGGVVHYQNSLILRPSFMPALYHLVRGCLLLGRRDSARNALTLFESAYRGLDQSRDFQQLTAAVAGRGPVPPPREFYIVQD